MSDSATIIAASLDSTQLEQSINKLVQTVASKTKEMADNFTSEVKRMENAVKNLGNIKIDSGGTADGGSSRRTKMLLEESLKAKEVAMTYDQMQAAFQRIAKDNSSLKDIRTFNKEELQSYIDLLRKLQAEYVRVNTQEGGGAKSDQIKRDMAELEKIIQGYQTILKNVEMINSRQGTIDVKKWTQDIGAVDDRYKKLVRWYTVLEKEDQRRIANEEKANQKRLAELEKEQNARQKMIESARKAEEKYQNAVLKTAFNKIVDLPSNNIDQMRTKLERLQTILANIRELGILSPKEIANAETEIGKLRGNIQQIEKIERERIAAERQFVVEQAKEIEQTQTLEGRIRSLTQVAKERLKEEGRFVDMQAYGKNLRIYDPSSPLAKGLSIEQQIKNALTEEKAAREGVSQSAQQQSGATQNVAKAQKEESESIRRNFRDYDSLRQAIASVLGIRSENVRLQGIEISSINNLSNRLKELRSVYNQLGTQDRHSERGKELISQIQNIERQMDRARKELSRPIDLKSALGTSEKTLDDIAYKMQRLSSYRSGLNVDTQKKEINTVNQEYDRLKKKMDEVMQKNQSMIASNNALGRSWNYMKNRLAFYFTVGASTQFIKNLIEVRSQYEMNEKALGILLDSASRGTRIFNELSQMSLVSPYTLIELSSAAKQLTAYDIAAKDVVDTTRRLADMASAVGVPVERLTYALGQIKAYGYLNSRDARMFANAGIPLVKQLADYYSELEGKMVSTADVYDRMKKKAIDYNDVMKVVTKMTDEGGKFFDFQAKMADTLKVRLANLTLAWNNMLNDLGKSNQGGLTTSIKSLTVVFRHWREIYRVVSTLIVALGAYKAATMLAGMTTKSSIGSSAVAAWFNLARGVKSAKDAVALFSLTLKSIPFTAWLTTIATLASYFYLFNNSTDGLKQKLEDIATAFDGVRKEITDLYADALKSDSIGSQLTKLRDMLELAQTELGVTIPIKLEEVNEGNVKQKLKEVKDIIDNYLNFSQEFSEAAAGTKFNELMNEFGANARSTYTGISESINTVVVALQNLVDKGNASKRDIEILNELTSGQKEDESRIEYLQRLVRLYEELGIVGKKVTTPSFAFFSSSTDNMDELVEKQNAQLDRLGVKNKTVFENMLKDVQGYYSSSSIAQYQFEQQIERVAKRIDINNIPVEQRTLKLSAAINEEASLNNWNQFEKEFARQVANQKFGTQIEISEESKGVAEQDLKDWQKKQQEWAAKNGITIPINFQTNDTEISYAKRMLQAAKDAKEEVEVQQRKLAVGTGSQDAVDAAKKAYENARILAKNAGADLEQLDKKANAAAKKAAKAAETELSKALKDELSTIEKVRSIYKELTKEGASHADAIKSATEGWKETVNAINRVLTKNGLKGLNLNDFVGVENPREILKTLQAQLDEMVKRGAKPAEIQVLQEKIKTIKVDAEKYDLTKITKGLNNELDRLKDEYELAVSLDADPELGSMFADWMGIDINDLPRTASEYAERASKEMNKYLKENKANVELPNLLNVTDDDLRAFEEMKVLTDAQLELVKKRVEEARGFYKKEVDDRIKDWDKLLEKYAEYETKVNKIHNDAVKERVSFAQQFGSEEDKSLALKLQTQILATTDPQERQRLIQQLQELVLRIAGDDKTKINLVTAISNSEQQGVAKADFEEFQKSPEWITATGDIASLTTTALDTLIDSLENYKKKAKNLDPKQVERINKALRTMRKEVRKDNPFSIIANAMDEAKARGDVFDEEISDIEQKIAAISAKISKQTSITGFADEDDVKTLEKYNKRLKELKDTQSEVTKISFKEVNEQINAYLGIASNVASVLSQIASTVKDADMARSAELASDIVGNLQAAGQGFASGGWIGAVIGGITDLVPKIFKWASLEADIDDSIKDSERSVKRLELAYVDLQQAVDKAYGTATIGAKQATLANKELQLAEIQRQIQLEKSRTGKNRDEDKIIDLQKQYKELFYEIKNGYTEIVDDLMGTDVASFAENLVSSMIDAFKQGEDYMKVFSDKFDEMIDNMIMKSIVSRVVSQYLDAVWSDLDKRINERTKDESNELAKLQERVTEVRNMSDDEIKEVLAIEQGARLYGFSGLDKRGITQEMVDEYRKAAQDEYDAAQKRLDAASAFTDSDVDYVMGRVTEIMPELGEKLQNILGQYYKFGESSETQLSALQQGIQGITEDTAGALEGYMNGVSQQVYYQSDLMTQIRDAVVGFSLDVQVATMSQILLQLRSSYEVQSAIHSVLEGWSSPNGMSVRVEMV